MTIRSMSIRRRAGRIWLGLIGAGAAASVAGCAPSEVDTSASYADGSYTADGGYQAPSGPESVTVTLTLADDVVTAVEVEGHATDRTAQDFQGRFASGIADVVVGVDIDALDVHRVAGSSLTSGGFRAAVDAIKDEAREN